MCAGSTNGGCRDHRRASYGGAHVVNEMPNLAGPHEFFADPFALYKAERRLSPEGRSVIAIYHSHPGSRTSLSDADRMAAARGFVPTS